MEEAQRSYEIQQHKNKISGNQVLQIQMILGRIRQCAQKKTKFNHKRLNILRTIWTNFKFYVTMQHVIEQNCKDVCGLIPYFFV